jgi:16S rRNA (guanine527-N7)-methyltransferase
MDKQRNFVTKEAIDVLARWSDVHQQALVDGAAGLGIALNQTQAGQFEHYFHELVMGNQRLNLTTVVEPAEVVSRHFLDSLACVLAFPREPRPLSVIDIGSGAGFPGLPLKIVRPELDLVLVEATGKKARFLESVVRRLELGRVVILNARIEDVGQDRRHRGSYDIAVCRAVANLAVLAEYGLPLLHLGGHLIAQKTAGIDDEVESAVPAIGLLGGKLLQPVFYDGRQLVVMKKIAATPTIYPRRAGIPAKRPLGRPKLPNVPIN